MSDNSPAAVARAVDSRRPITTVVAAALALALAISALSFLHPRAADGTTRPRITSATTVAYATAMLALLNQERHAHHRRPLTMSRQLRTSAHRHNLHMAKADTLSHQLPHEAYFGTRISNTGYRWSWAGENIGWTTALSKGGVLELERRMYGEVPPADGHRQNILSTDARQVGIDVYYDARHHRLWFTQDFGRRR